MKRIWRKIVVAVRKMKLSKAVGIDEVPMEVWKHGGIAIRRGGLDKFGGAEELRWNGKQTQLYLYIKEVIKS